MLKYGIVGVLVALSLSNTSASDANCGSDPSPDFRAPGRRLSEEKCLEYNWRKKNVAKCSTEPAHIKYPFMGMVGLKKETTGEVLFRCAAFLISPKYALSDAVCLTEGQLHHQSPSYVRFGNSDIVSDVPRYDAKIKRTIVHPSFDKSKKIFDIGLVEFEEAVPMSKSIQPVCLWSQPSLEGVEDAVAPGWGTDPVTRKLGANLKEMKVKVLDAATCEAFAKSRKIRLPKLEDHQLCANESAINSLCQGSNGVPLVTSDSLAGEDVLRAFAITSFGSICSKGPDPEPTLGVYTKVPSFIDWIEENVWAKENIS